VHSNDLLVVQLTGNIRDYEFVCYVQYCDRSLTNGKRKESMCTFIPYLGETTGGIRCDKMVGTASVPFDWW